VATTEAAFPSRLLALGGLEAAGAVDRARINQHIVGQPDGKRVMVDEEVDRLLNDPYAKLVLRQGHFPKTLGELIGALDQVADSPDALPQQSTFLISEGGQIPFSPGIDKGGGRLLTVRFRNNAPELMISCLLPPGVSPRTEEVLLEVIAWDPVNRTFHFYQRQEGAWFWCGQSDMALTEPTRGHGPFDSHINGYPLMKELKTPWVHWHGPGLGISETAFASDDPIVTDPLFTDKDHALNFETRVVRPLAERWNVARFEKSLQNGTLTSLPTFMRQVLEATSFNLISTHTEFTQLPGQDLADLPPTFFFDQDGLVSEIGLQVEVPALRMSGARYLALTEQHDLRVRGGSVDLPGDVPFCFTVPEPAFEDELVLKILLQRGVLSPRLAACLLMIDFANPLGSSRRAALTRHLPEAAGTDPATNLDAVLVPALQTAAAASPDGSPEREFVTHWDLGPDAWPDVFADRLEAYLGKVAALLATDPGSDAVFRLAESRRREIRTRALAEFDLSLPIALSIPNDAPVLEMTEQAEVRPRAGEA
jgi:hypothetical protein